MTDAVRLEFYTLTGSLRLGAFASALDDQTSIAAQIVTMDGALEQLEVGLDLEGFYTRPGDASYAFVTRIVALDTKSGELRCSPPQRVHRLQRREFLRLPLTIRVDLAVAGPRRLTEPGPSGWCEATATNVSAAGLGVSCAEVLPVGQVVLTRFSLPTRHDPLDVETRSLVTRIALDPERQDDSSRLAYGLVFVDLARPVEEAIVAAVHWMQAEQRHN
jgi:c-di-GMP-binding flagellar brake protein YcgR